MSSATATPTPASSSSSEAPPSSDYYLYVTAASLILTLIVAYCGRLYYLQRQESRREKERQSLQEQIANHARQRRIESEVAQVSFHNPLRREGNDLTPAALPMEGEEAAAAALPPPGAPEGTKPSHWGLGGFMRSLTAAAAAAPPQAVPREPAPELPLPTPQSPRPYQYRGGFDYATAEGGAKRAVSYALASPARAAVARKTAFSYL
jgi:hypothetical protein